MQTVFSQPDHQSATKQLHEVARMLSPKFPQATELLQDAAEDVLAHLLFPRENRRRLHSTNSLERLWAPCLGHPLEGWVGRGRRRGRFVDIGASV